MKLDEAIGILERHNKWRRGCNEDNLVSPIRLGIAIDVIIDYFKKSEK